MEGRREEERRGNKLEREGNRIGGRMGCWSPNSCCLADLLSPSVNEYDGGDGDGDDIDDGEVGAL